MADEETSAARELKCELCIIGAGYAGLNGLNAAARYLAKGDRVVVVDRNATWGGNWLHQYDYVRLHQPYRMFTAGDQPWELRGRSPSYLATRREVLDHLATVPRVSAGHLDVVPLFGHEYVSRSLRDGSVEVVAKAVGDRKTVKIRAQRMLMGTGVQIEPLPAFPISSGRVRSISVTDPAMSSPELLESDAPAWVIGSGKTAMDTAIYLLRNRRRGPVNMLSGSGMWFFRRDGLFPPGRARWTEGRLILDLFREMAEGFDGSNEAALFEGLARQGYAHHVFGRGGNCRIGVLSDAEREEVRAGVATAVHGHLIDVDGSRMSTRDLDGRERREAVPDGTWLVNCTTHFRNIPHEPLLQDRGRVCVPQFGLGFSGTTAYFLTHLWMLDRLSEVDAKLFRVRIDIEPKLRLAPHIALMITANVALIGEHLPLSVSARFQGDFNKWYPVPRQVLATLRLLAKRRRLIEQADRHLGLRFVDPPETDLTPPMKGHYDSVGTRPPTRGVHPLEHGDASG